MKRFVCLEWIKGFYTRPISPQPAEIKIRCIQCSRKMNLVHVSKYTIQALTCSSSLNTLLLVILLYALGNLVRWTFTGLPRNREQASHITKLAVGSFDECTQGRKLDCVPVSTQGAISMKMVSTTGTGKLGWKQ